MSETAECITLITPAPPGSRAGNRATAERWAGLLDAAGYPVRVVTEYHGEKTRLLIALHAWRSQDAIESYRRQYPQGPLLVVLTGTDIYRFQHSHPGPTLASMEAADILVGLHRLVAEDIPARFRDKLMTVLQSAPLLEQKRAPETGRFCVSVIGHLREEKDSLRAALAARLVPSASRLQVIQAGKPHDEAWRAGAELEQRENPRYQWVGELDKEGVQELMGRSQAMVMSSLMEGGANVVSEACRAGCPVIASDIPGNRGLLGDDYPAYYPAGDEQALARLLVRLEQDQAWRQLLEEHVAARAPDFTPEAEQASLVAAVEAALASAA